MKKIYQEQPQPVPVEQPQNVEVYDDNTYNESDTPQRSSSKSVIITLIILAVLIGAGAWFFFTDPMELFKNKKVESSSGEESTEQTENAKKSTTHSEAISYEEESLPPMGDANITANQPQKQTPKTNTKKEEKTASNEAKVNEAKDASKAPPKNEVIEKQNELPNKALDKALDGENATKPKTKSPDYDEKEAEKQLKAIQGIE